MVLESQRLAAVEQPPLEPGLDQVVVVISRDHDELPVTDRVPQLGEERAGDLDDLRDGPVAELERVAEDDDPVRPLDGLEQKTANRGRRTRSASDPEPR